MAHLTPGVSYVTYDLGATAALAITDFFQQVFTL
jgi:hypothetical protein